MSEINDVIKQLITHGRKEEATVALVEEYGFTEDKAIEFYERYKEANTKTIKPGAAGKMAKGCGCFTIFFAAVFVFSLYTGIKSLENESVAIESSLVDYKEVEQVDQFDAKILIDYYPVVKYEFEGTFYIDTLTSPIEKESYSIGQNITVYINPEVPEFATLKGYGLGDVIGDAVVWLVLAFVAFIAYRFLKRLSFKFSVAEKVQNAINDNIEKAAESTEETSEPTTENTIPSKRPVIKKKGNPLILTIIGIGIILWGLGYGYYTYQSNVHGDILSDGIKVTGEVMTKSESRTGSNNSSTYYFTIEYQFEEEYFTLYHNSTFSDYEKGDKVEIIVNPDNPEDASINTSSDIYKGSYFWSLVLLLVGAWLSKSGYTLWNKEGRPAVFKSEWKS